MKPTLSPRDLAAAIGVSESSIKRWVDEGVIPAARTTGGHRRIATQDALRFVRDSKAIVSRPEILGLRELAAIELAAAGDVDLADEEDQLHGFLVRGAAEEARGLLLALYLRGWSVAQIVDGPLVGALERIGELWRHQEPGIFLEHRATEIAIQSISRLRGLFGPTEAPKAVGGAPSGDPYVLGSLSAATLLESCGIRAINLGPNTPLDALALAVQDEDARLVWLSVSRSREADQLARQVIGLLGGLVERSVPLVVGGRGAPDLKLPSDPYLHVGATMAELEALLKGLRVGRDLRSQ